MIIEDKQERERETERLLEVGSCQANNKSPFGKSWIFTNADLQRINKSI